MKLHNTPATNPVEMDDVLLFGLHRSVACSVSDDQGQVLYANQLFTDLSGYSAEELIGSKHNIVNSGYHPKSFFKELWQTIGSGKSWSGEICNRNKRGQHYWVRCTITPYETKQGQRNYVNVSVDITAQKQAELEKQNALNIIDQVSKSTPTCIYQYVHRPDGTAAHTMVSQAAETIYEYKIEEIYADINKVFARIHPDDIKDIAAGIQESAKTLNPWHRDYRLKFEDGRVKWIEGYALPTRDRDGSVYFHGTLNDITERKKLEEQLIVNTKMAALGQLASGIAHEVNNPLMIILGKVNRINRLLAESPVKADLIQADVNRISDMVKRMGQIISGLRGFSRNGNQDPFQPANIKNIINDTISLAVERFKHNAVKLRQGDILDLEVECRATQISQVILNLMVNACDAVQELPERWVQVDTEVTERATVKIIVTDSGPGIPKEIAEKLMMPFFTTKPVGKGTGLGLSISRGIAADHGGSLVLDPSSQRTQFILELPLKQGQSSVVDSGMTSDSASKTNS